MIERACTVAAALVFALPAFAQHEDHAAHMKKAAAMAGQVEDVSGLSIPDVEVLTQDGNTVHFYTDLVADRVVAMNFIFTTCTTICPPMGAIFGQLEKELGDRAGRDVYLISISVDPTTDTPQRLEKWAAKFGRKTGGREAGANTAGWTLVTGEKPTVDSLLKSLQVFNPDFADHAPIVLLGNDARDEWTRAYGLAPPDRLEKILERLAAPADPDGTGTGGS